MKKLLFSILLSVISVSYVYAQCGPGGCPLPGARPFRERPFDRGPFGRDPYPSPPNLNPRDNFPLVPQELREKILKASVKVYSQRGRTIAMGSGTIIKYAGHVGVTTAGHVPESTDVAIWNRYIGNVKCVLRGISRNPDWAILEPEEKQEELYELALEFRYPGYDATTQDKVLLCGYDASEEPKLWRGTLRSTLSNSNLEILGPARQGDSGGGVFDMDGNLMAIIWGSDFRTNTFATDRTVVIEYIQKHEDTCFGWRRPFGQKPKPQPPAPKPEAPKVEPKPEPKPEHVPEHKPEHVPEHKSCPEHDNKLPIIRGVLDFFKPTLYVFVGWLAFLPVLTITRIILAFR